MGQGFFEGACKLELRSFGRDAKDGFAEAEDTVGGRFEGLRGGIAGGAGDDNMQRGMGKKSGGGGGGGGGKGQMRGGAPKRPHRVFCARAVSGAARESVPGESGGGGGRN